MWSGILGVIAGFLVWSVLWVGGNQLLTRALPAAFRPDGSTNSVGVLLLLLVASVIISVISGYLAARIAGATSMNYVWGLAVLLLLVGGFVQAGAWTLLPLWYHLLFLGLLIPATLAGGWLRLGRF